MNRILSLQFYLVSSSTASPWPEALPLQLRGPNYGSGDTNTFSNRMFEQFTEYLTKWQICQVPMSSEGWKAFSLGEGASPLTPWPGVLPWTPLGAPLPDPRYNPPLQIPSPRHWRLFSTFFGCFCRAMLCISAAYAVICPSVRPSVRLSVGP